MKNTHVEKHLPNSVLPVIHDFNDRVGEKDAEHNATTPTQIDWTDLARAAVALPKARSTDITPLLQEVMAAKRAIRENPATPPYIDENFLNEFAAAVATAVDSRVAAATAGKDATSPSRG